MPKEEAEQVVDLLKRAGKTVDAHFYPNEGHGFEKRENQIDAIKRTIAWFDKYLKGEGPGADPRSFVQRALARSVAGVEPTRRIRTRTYNSDARRGAAPEEVSQ